MYKLQLQIYKLQLQIYKLQLQYIEIEITGISEISELPAMKQRSIRASLLRTLHLPSSPPQP
jgi:hypothetical protein